MSESITILREIAQDTRQVVAESYRDRGIVDAIFTVLALPFVLPLVVAFYYSIDKEHRDALDEWEGMK